MPTIVLKLFAGQIESVLKFEIKRMLRVPM